MGRLMEIARSVTEEQDRAAVGGGTGQTSGLGNGAISVGNTELPAAENAFPGNDRNDINDQSPAANGIAPVCQPRRFSPKPEDIDEFFHSHQVVRVHLAAISETVLFIADNASPPEGLFDGGYITYCASEWKAMIRRHGETFPFSSPSEKMLWCQD